MARLTVRKLDDSLKSELKIRAAQHGRSMSMEVRVMIREKLHPSPRKPGMLGTRMREYVMPFGGMELEIPQRELPREPPDFSGSEYGE